MTRYKIKLAVFFFVLFITGCTKKDELKLPVTIHFKIEFRQPVIQYHWDNDPWYNEVFNIDECQFGIKGMRFEGRRETGGDVFFETDPHIIFPTIKLSNPMNPTTITSFDIPQGIYNYMKYDIFLRDITTYGLASDYDIGSENAGFIISGKYVKEWWTEPDFFPSESYTIPFILIIDDTEIFNLVFYPDFNSGKIVIEHDKEYIALLYLDLYHVFKSISTQSIENAEVSGNGPDQIIIISGEKNKNLYENLLFRLAQSSTVIIY